MQKCYNGMVFGREREKGLSYVFIIRESVEEIGVGVVLEGMGSCQVLVGGKEGGKGRTVVVVG